MRCSNPNCAAAVVDALEARKAAGVAQQAAASALEVGGFVLGAGVFPMAASRR